MLNLEKCQKTITKTKKTIESYTNEYIYNISWFTIFWKIIPDSTLVIQQKASKKYNKTEIIINLGCNVTDLHKQDIKFIGKAVVAQYGGYF